MIIVRVELHSAITGRVTELARARICNSGTGTLTQGDYEFATLRGRDSVALDRGQVQRSGRVKAWPRQSLHVWYLVAEALAQMGYGRARRGEARDAR